MPDVNVLPQNPAYPANQKINIATGNAANIPPEVSDFFGNYIGMIAKKRCVLHYLAQQVNLPTKSGSSIVIPTFETLKDTDVSLQEGVTPVGTELKRTILKITPTQIGNYTTISDVAVLTVQDSTLQHAAQLLGINLAEACDKMIAKELIESVKQYHYCTGVVNQPGANNVGSLTDNDIIAVSNQLKINGAYLVAPNMFGSQIYGSTPVSEAFYCFANTKIEPDLYSIPSFFTLSKYGSSASAHWLAGEVGECMNVRFVLTNNIPETTSEHGATADKPVMNNFVLGRYAYYTSTLGMGSSEFIFGSTGFDPLRQRYTVAYKAWFACKVNEAHPWIINMLCKTSKIARLP